jgi:RNA polymerase sigma factor (sigma-70 family)
VPDSVDEHLFRREHGRIVAALARIFGVHNLALAEDVAQDAFVRAAEVWKVRGVPDNPGAWLMQTAKNRALDTLRRAGTARDFAPELGRLLDSEWTRAALVDESFASGTVRDEQLRMMFSCCHPSLSEETQLALILNVLCGFGAAEIAACMLATRAAIEKRIARGKHDLAQSKRLFELSDRDFAARLETVQRALYLLFSEGYHGASPGHDVVREDLCAEAMRLVALLREHPAAATPATHALAALMCLQAARLPARMHDGALSALDAQDRARWDERLVVQGLALFEQAQAGTALSAFHVEAAIAVVHASAARPDAIDWAHIVSLYDRLASIAPSPIVALNRAIAIGRRDGPHAGLAALDAIHNDARLHTYPFYCAARAELELRVGDVERARAHFSQAHALARSDAERSFFARRLNALAH